MTGKLNILIKDLDDEKEREMSSIISDVSQINLLECEVTEHDLNDTVAFLSDNIQSLKNLNINIRSINSDVINGKVILEIIGLNEEIVETVRSFCNVDFLILKEFVEINNEVGLIFEESQQANERLATTFVEAGGNVYEGDRSTISFIAKKGSDRGFVMSGHAGHTVGSKVSGGGYHLGEVIATAWYSGTTADAAFVKVPDWDSIVLSPFLAGTNDLICDAWIGEAPVNTTIFAKGSTTGFMQGKITAVNKTVAFANGIELKNQYGSNLPVAHGDSGCPVLILGGNGGLNEYTLLGTINSNYGDFSIYKNIVSELGIEILTTTS